MKPWVRSAAAGAALLAFAGLLIHRCVGRRDGAPSSDPEPAQWAAPPESLALDSRSGAKVRIVDDLIAGRLTLLETAAAFRDADAREGPRTMVAAGFPGCSSLDEAYCRSVIAYAGERSCPATREALTRGLEAELAARLRDGTLHLCNAGP